MRAHATNAIQIILWQDIFAVVDDGRARPEDYEILRKLIVEQTRRYPRGVGCLAIIPVNATPPSDAAREALNAALEAVSGTLKCMCWLVEGTGFQGAMVRAILTGLRIVGKRAYATHVSTGMDEALGWMITQLRKPEDGAIDVGKIREALQGQRRR